MAEVMLAVRLFAATLVIAFLMQIKVSGVSIESHLDVFMRTSIVTSYLQDAAQGGSQLIQRSYQASKKFVLDSTRTLGPGLQTNQEGARR